MTVESDSGLHHQFSANLKTVQQRLERYVNCPNEESIHDVRTAIRRLRMAYSGLPESCRSSSSDSYLQACRNFFRNNSEIRDCDVIKEKFLDRGLDTDDELIQLLDRRRGELLREALELAISLTELEQPQLHVSGADCRDRYHAQIDKHATRFLSNLPLVISTESDSDTIHCMRKDAKKLFYLLEMDPELATLERMIHLKRFQRISGDLHDCDVAIGYLRANMAHGHAYRKLFETEEVSRHQLYVELCDLLRNVDWEKILSSGLRR